MNQDGEFYIFLRESLPYQLYVNCKLNMQIYI